MEVSRRWVERWQRGEKSGDKCEIRKLRADTLFFQSEERASCAKNKVIKLCWRLEINVSDLEELQLELQFKVKVKVPVGPTVSEKIRTPPRAVRANWAGPARLPGGSGQADSLFHIVSFSTRRGWQSVRNETSQVYYSFYLITMKIRTSHRFLLLPARPLGRNWDLFW